jgi:hypothetical protein
MLPDEARTLTKARAGTGSAGWNRRASSRTPGSSDQVFKGSHVRSYLTREPVRVLDEFRGWQQCSPKTPAFDTSFDFKTDKPAKTRTDPDGGSPKLHELLWTKTLRSRIIFAPKAQQARKDGCLIFTDPLGTRHWFGSDAVTNSYSG